MATTLHWHRGMLVYRSFVVGLLGAIALLLATLPGELRARQARPGAALTLADAALPLDERLPALLGLAPGERVVGVEVLVSDGRAVRPVGVYWSTMPRLAQ